MSTVGVVVTRWDRPASMAVRAVESASAADAIVVANSGKDPLWLFERFSGERSFEERHRPEYSAHQMLSWHDAVAALDTDYVSILFDDDWYEPGFIPACKSALDDGAGYAFTESTIRFPNGETCLNLGWSFRAPVRLPVAAVERIMLAMAYVVTPACCMFRREDLLASILPCIPGAPRQELSGPDALLTLLPLLWRESVHYSPEPMVNLGAGDDSTTIMAMREGRGDTLLATYNDARRFYLAIKYAGYRRTPCA